MAGHGVVAARWKDFELDLIQAGIQGHQIKLGPAERVAYECDAYTVDRSEPFAILLPESTEQVSQIVKICRKFGFPITPRGAGTGLSGGATAALGGIILSTKKLNKIFAWDAQARVLKAGAGVVNLNISKEVASAKLHFAPDPSSQTVSTLGGNIAENSGGPHTLKYGVTAQHILALTIVDPLGNILELGGNVPGRPGPDWLSLIVGSEGMLGTVTEATVRLTPLPDAVQTVLIAFSTIRGATQTVASIIAEGVIPAALEMMDSGILLALNTAFGLEYPKDSAALLLIECDATGADAEAKAKAEMDIVLNVARTQRCIDVQVAANSEERAKLWVARKKGVGAMGRLAPTIVTHDGVIPRSKLPEMLETIAEVAAHHGIGVANIFHAGDGNLHPCFYFDDRFPDQVEAVIHAGETIMKKCLELGGSLSGEHGIGLEKASLMESMFSAEDLKFQSLALKLFQADELTNPCKVIPNQKGCIEHQRSWKRHKGVAW